MEAKGFGYFRHQVLLIRSGIDSLFCSGRWALLLYPLPGLEYFPTHKI